MKHKVAELEGALLDAAVAKASGLDVYYVGNGGPEFSFWAVGRRKRCDPYSTEWAHAGPIIERERIDLAFAWRGTYDESQSWVANLAEHITGADQSIGLTPLIAAMRAYVASKFGEEVELPP